MDSDKRSGIDRREQTVITFRLLVGNGNRRIIRRQEGRRRIFLVDQYSPIVFMTIVSILFLCVIDALLTFYLLNYGAYELNPLMAYLLMIGPFAFFIPKYAITTIATLGLFIFRGVVIRKLQVSTQTLLYLIAWIYTAVVAWELYLVYYVT